ncbi:MAG: hypothetical protein SGI74_07515 [Oligoflexia bacterium]|nr:hypothetical protein [Oligoflexia bacterium]
MKTAVVVILALGFVACNKSSDNNGQGVPPGVHNGLNPQTGQPWNNVQGQGPVNFQQVHIAGGRISNRTLFVQPAQSRTFEETSLESCNVRDLYDSPRPERRKGRFARNVYDINLNFDAQGNLNIVMVTPIGMLKNSQPIQYKLNRGSQTIEINRFALEGSPSMVYVSKQQEMSARLAALQERERRRFDSRDDRDDRSRNRRDRNINIDINASIDGGFNGSWDNEPLFGNGNYGNSDLGSGGFNPDFQIGQNPNPAAHQPNNPYFDSGFNTGNPGAGTLIASFPGLVGRIHVLKQINPQHITHIEVGAPRSRNNATPPARYRLAATVTSPDYGICESDFRVDRADFTLQ